MRGKNGGVPFPAWLLVLSFTLSGSSGAMAAEDKVDFSARELIERLTRIETKVEEGQKSLQRQIDDIKGKMGENQKNLQRQIDENQKNLQRQLDELKNFLLWGFGITFMGMFALVGFVLWDRRTALAPTMNQVEDLRRRERDIEELLRKYASREPELAGIMRSMGMLSEREP